MPVREPPFGGLEEQEAGQLGAGQPGGRRRVEAPLRTRTAQAGGAIAQAAGKPSHQTCESQGYNHRPQPVTGGAQKLGALVGAGYDQCVSEGMAAHRPREGQGPQPCTCRSGDANFHAITLKPHSRKTGSAGKHRLAGSGDPFPARARSSGGARRLRSLVEGSHRLRHR